MILRNLVWLACLVLAGVSVVVAAWWATVMVVVVGTVVVTLLTPID